MKSSLIHSFILTFLLGVFTSTFAQNIDTSPDRNKTDLAISLPRIGTVKPRKATDITSSNWLIGCETLDRDYADYDQYKEYLVPLGIKRIRLQAGWDKTEHVKGQYDWAWLDHIIDDAHQRGLQPWLQASYGNHLYPNGGGSNLGAGVPTSPEALTAWDRWVEAMVKRYKNKVVNWEIWNEPNFGDNEQNTPDRAAALTVRTIDIIKRIQPEAKVSGMALGHTDLDYADTFFKVLAQKNKLKLFDNITYHDYVYNPDSHYPQAMLLRTILDKYAPNLPLRQGENGAPSVPGYGRGALGNYDWSELTQAKWDTRRMLGDLGHDIESSVFTIIDIAYTGGPITRLNCKGLIQSDSTKRAIRPKIAYYAVQNVAALFDNSLQRIKNMKSSHNRNLVPKDNMAISYATGTDRSMAVYGYRHKTTGKQVFTIWKDDYIPVESNKTEKLTLTFANANFDQPVYVDIISGAVYEIPASQWKKNGAVYTFTDIPVYDAPILIADKSLVL